MTKPNATPWSPESVKSAEKLGDNEPFPVPLNEQEIELIQNKRNKAFKVVRFFVVAFTVAGIIWALLSGYYEPLMLAAGAILLTLGIWLLVRKTYNKELLLKEKFIYTGEVKKSTYETGSGKSKTTHYVVRIGNYVLENMDLYSSFADDDEVEVHLSRVKKIVLKKEIVKGTGNLEYNSIFKRTELPQDVENEDYLTDDEIACLKNRIKKNLKIIYYTLLIVPVTGAFIEWLLWYVDLVFMSFSVEIYAPVLGSLAFVFLVVYYFALYRVQSDLKSGKKRLLQTQIIDKEKKSYSGTTDYVIKTVKKEFRPSYKGYELFENHEKIEIHMSFYRRKLIQISSLDVKNKIYKSENFFKDL